MEGSFLARDKLFNVQSPATVRDGENMHRRTLMMSQQYQSLKMLDESVAPNTSLMHAAITPILKSGQKAQSSLRKTRFDLLNPSSRLSSINASTYANLDLSIENFELDKTRHLVEPITPGYAELTTTMHVMPEEDPGLAATSSLYTDFKHCLQKNESESDVFELLASYEEVCADHEVLLKKLTAAARPDLTMNSAVDLMKVMKDEKRTWRLIACLYNDRLKADALEGSMIVDDIHVPKLIMIVDDIKETASEKKIVNNFFKENSEIRQAQIIIDWLERNSADDMFDLSDQVQHYSENVTWENTLHYLKQRKLRGDQGTGHIVSQMDPDAPTRQRKPLADLDRSDEVRLLKSMFSFIRAGEIEKAQDLCMYCGQAWRVASLEGWKLYNDPNMENLKEDGPDQIEGNPLRDLWKLACWTISQDESVHTFERAVYGSLCGNVKSMLNVCISWEDYLWAHYKAMVDTTVEHQLSNSVLLEARERPECAGAAIQLPKAYWNQRIDLASSRDIFEQIQAVSNEVVRQEEGAPFHVIQKCIILEDTAEFIDSAHGWVTQCVDYDGDVASIHPQLLRFLTHLILFFRTIGVSLDDEKSEVILESYVRYLASEERTSQLVANYTAMLNPVKQVIVYSDFLKTVEDKDMRQQFLELANDAGLDIPTITKTVVEDIRQQGDIDLTGSGGRKSSDANMTVSHESFDPSLEPAMTPDDWRKIEALEWLVFDSSQRSEAIKQCNALMRTFLAAGKFTAANEVFQKIPAGSIDIIHREWNSKVPGSSPLPPADENAIKEYLCMQAYLSAQQSFKDWFKYFHYSKPKDSEEEEIPTIRTGFSNTVAKQHVQKKLKDDMKKWEDTCKKISATLRDQIYNVLMFPMGGWLVDAHEMEDTDEVRRRHHQMNVVRRMCIPVLCHLLINVLKSMKDMKEECMHLADVLANEDYQLYKVFTKEEGRKILSRVQDMAVDLVE